MPSPGIAVPGTVVPSGSQASPAGAQGIQGPAGGAGSAGPAGANSWTLSTGSFTVPAIGSTAVMTVNDTSWAVLGEYVWIATAGGDPNTPMALQVTAKTATTLTLLNPATQSTSLPSTNAGNLLGTGSDGLLYLSASTVSAAAAPSTDAGNLITEGSDSQLYLGTPAITLVRLRSFNAVGNPTFEVDQRTVGSSVVIPYGNAWSCDRWLGNRTSSSAMALSTQVQSSNIAVPGTNFYITQKFFRVTLTTTQASLASTDGFYIGQTVEGPSLRELIGDVTSASLLVRSSVAPLKFSLSLQGIASNYSICKLCTINLVNTWTLIQIPNIAVWPATTWNIAPGTGGYYFFVVLAAGSGLTTPASDVWQSSRYYGAVGQDNFVAQAVNSTFDIAFIQHEPGPQCTTLQDCPFGVNLDGPMGCLRYYQKSYEYGVAVGSVTSFGQIAFVPTSTVSLEGTLRYPKLMAKAPTVTGYNPATGAINSFRHVNGTDYSISSFSTPGTAGFAFINTGTMAAVAAGQVGRLHYTADTGW